MNNSSLPVAIIGSGPAALMAAHVIASSGRSVRIFEKKQGPGKKLLIAGSSGLNVTYDAPLETFHEFYRGPQDGFKKIFATFSPNDWLKFIEALGIGTFKGTSRRYFVEGLKASALLRAWLLRLEKLGATISYNAECVEFEALKEKVILRFADNSVVEAAAVCFALGGGSYEEREKPLRWPEIFKRKGLRFEKFAPSNVGYNAAWPAKFIEEAEGLPLKNIVLHTSTGSKQGDLVITRYGLEGTPIYFHAKPGTAWLDLAPDLSVEQISERLARIKENLSPIRRLKRCLKLSAAAQALLFHLSSREELDSLNLLTSKIKRFPIELLEPRSIDEAISTSGGLDWSELDDNLMLHRHPRVFAAGEMLNWDAPTGGFLIQACVSQGFVAGHGIINYEKL